MTRARAAALVGTFVLTLASLVLATRLELSKDLTTLFPRTPAAAMLARVTRAFGGGDVALVLVRGADPEATERAARAAAAALRALPSVASVMDELPAAPAMDPTEAWRFAGPRARERLARALTEEGMRERLRETRALLLAPGAPVDLVARDPLRLALVPFQDDVEVAAGVRGSAGGAFVADGGRSRLVAVEPRGRAFSPGEAARFTAEAEAALARVNVPGVRLELTGGHVIARQTELLMRGDLQRSGVLSGVLASVVFAIAFRRVRALVAVLPPLAAGTLWTTALAATLYPRLSAVACAFAAVVVGVGVDTGVHVYGRLLDARRDGLSPSRAASVARAETWRPTLGAAVAAGAAFGCLALSEIEGMRQLGVLCAAGEVLTALAILVVVPELGALLERGTPPAKLRSSLVPRLTATRGRSAFALAVLLSLLAAAVVLGRPRIDHAVASFDARAIPALGTYEAIYATFGGKRGQLVVVAADPDAARARARADAIAEALDRRGGIGYDALARLVPSPELQRARLAERDRLDLPAKVPLLRRVAVEQGFDPEALAPAFAALEAPSMRAEEVDAPPWLRHRHLATDDEGALAVVYVRADDADVRAAIRGADPSAVLTGYADLEAGLGRTLSRDLPRVLGGAFGVVLLVLAVSLRRPSRVAVAALVLVVEIAIVLVLARLLGVRWHVYDALVLPVLLGITLDEVLFLLEAAERRSIEEALAEQAPLGTATALTTAAGFGALVICRFDGLVDVGKVGALGSVTGLLVALVLVPAAARLGVLR